MDKAAIQTFDEATRALHDTIVLLGRTAPDGASSSEARALVSKAYMLLVHMKPSSRTINVAIEDLKQAVLAKKSQLEEEDLSLQSLLREKLYLERELVLCRKFPMPNLRRAEAEEGRPILEGTDAVQTPEQHQVRLETLQKQMQQRRALQEQQRLLRAQLDDSVNLIGEQQQFIERIPSLLADVETSTLPLQKYFKLKLSAGRDRLRVAADLPVPLHTLFGLLDAYCRVHPESGSVQTVPAVQWDGKSGDAAAGSEKALKRRKVEEVAVPGDVAAAVASEILRCSPTAVELSLRMGGSGGGNGGGNGGACPEATALPVRFQHLPELDLVVVAAPPQFPNLLVNLFPDDTGVEPPPAAAMAAAAAARRGMTEGGGIDAAAVAAALAAMPSRPYKWAQRLAGTMSLWVSSRRPMAAASEAAPAAATAVAEVAAGGVEPSTQAAMARLRARARTALALQEQFQAFEGRTLPLPRPAAATAIGGAAAIAAAPVSGAMASWEEIQAPRLDLFESPAAAAAAKADGEGEMAMMVDGGEQDAAAAAAMAGRVRHGCRYFRATVKGAGRGAAMVDAVIEVPAEYPVALPRFRLSQQSSGGSSSSGDGGRSAEELAALEAALGGRSADQLRTTDVTAWDWLLTHQVWRLHQSLSGGGGSKEPTAAATAATLPAAKEVGDALVRKYLRL